MMAGWLGGSEDVPRKVAAWIEALTFVHEAAEDQQHHEHHGEDRPRRLDDTERKHRDKEARRVDEPASEGPDELAGSDIGRPERRRDHAVDRQRPRGAVDHGVRDVLGDVVEVGHRSTPGPVRALLEGAPTTGDRRVGEQDGRGPLRCGRTPAG